jgi:putative peptidoglycan lipid II flippase
VLILFHDSLGIFALAYGLLVGTAVELALLVTLVRRETAPVFSLDLAGSHLKELAARFVPTIIGAALMASTLLVDQVMSSGLPAGSISALNYASRIVTVPLALTAAALGVVVLPYFSALVAEKRWPELRRTTMRYLLLAGLVTFPISIGLAAAASPMIEFALHRGAFQGTDVATVASTTAALALQVPFYTGVILLMRLALALKLNIAIAWMSAANLVMTIVLNAWLAGVMGVTGIALSTSLVYACSFGMLLVLTWRRLDAAASSRS